MLVFNYVMDSQDPLLSHQLEAVKSLASNFNMVTVVTGRVGIFEMPENVQVINSDWVPAQKLRNIVRLLAKSIPIIFRGDFRTVFFHMTDLQCAIVSPLLWIRRRHQYLWYAHTRNSIYLRWSSIWVNSVITSTLGSCPLKNSKVIAIGQAIDVTKFTPIKLTSLNLDKLIHIGRFDKSKNIEKLVESADNLRAEFKDITLTIVGSPANQDSKVWAQNLIGEFSEKILQGWLNLSPSIPREQFPARMAQNGCFFHAYVGSLDKTLVESTMLQVPVVSINPEYVNVFGRWGSGVELSLENEYRALRKLDFQELEQELLRRYLIAEKNHSLQNWVDQLSQLLE